MRRAAATGAGTFGLLAALACDPSGSAEQPLQPPQPAVLPAQREAPELELEAAAQAELEAAAQAELEIVAYPAPVVEEARVERAGRRATAVLRWGAIDTARRYQVQLSRGLTFEHPLADREVARPLLRQKRLKPGIYFWRVRAVGAAGRGVYSDVQVLDATVTGKRRGRRAAVASRAGAEQPRRGQPPPRAAPSELTLIWSTPAAHAVVTENPAAIQGETTPGALLRLGSIETTSPEASFLIPVRLQPGRNDLTLVAELAGLRQVVRRSVFYADPGRLQPLRSRLETLRRQLDEIQAMRAELSATLAALEARLRNAERAAEVAELKEEVERISSMQHELEAEVNRALDAIDRLLGG